MLSRFSRRFSNLVSKENLSAVNVNDGVGGRGFVRFYNDSINADNLRIELTKSPKTKSAYKDLAFGAEFSDHMLEIDWNEKDGWKDPIIREYHNFNISPAASVFHYALEAFEGMKAYKDNDDNIRLFRPNKNWDRLNKSCDTLAFPTFNSNQFQKCVEKLISIDRDWIPNQDGYSLYLRPTVISTYVC